MNEAKNAWNKKQNMLSETKPSTWNEEWITHHNSSKDILSKQDPLEFENEKVQKIVKFPK